MKSILLNKKKFRSSSFREPCFKENIECDIQKKVLHVEYRQL